MRSRMVVPACALTLLAAVCAGVAVASVEGVWTARRVAPKAGLIVGGVAVDSRNNVLVADTGSLLHGLRIRRVTPAGIVNTIAGGGPNTRAHEETIKATQAMISHADDGVIAVDRKNDIFVGDFGSFRRVVEITPDGMLKTVAGGLGSGNQTKRNGVPALSEPISPEHLAADGLGNLFIGDHFGVLKVDPSGIVHYFVGDPEKPATNPKSLKLLNRVYGLATAPNNDLYVVDGTTNGRAQTGRYRLLKVKPSGSVSLFLRSKLIFRGIAIDARGNVYAQVENPKDRGDGVLEKFSPAGKLLARIAGGSPSYHPHAPPLGNFFASQTLAVDTRGNIFYTHAENVQLWRLSPAH